MNLSKKEVFLGALFAVLAGFYVVFFSGWLKPKIILVEHSIRASREGWAGSNRVASATSGPANVTFALHKPYKLTSVKVVRLADLQADKNAHPVWHLASESGSKPADGFAYGFAVEGMKPFVAGTEPEPLEPGVEYQLQVEAGSLKGTNDFKVEGNLNSRR